MGLPQILQGTLKSTDIAPFKEKIYVDEKILYEDTNAWRFQALLDRLGASKGVPSRTLNYMQQSLQPVTMTVLSAAAAGATTITVDHPEYCHRDNKLMVMVPPYESAMMNEDIGGTTAEGKVTVMNCAGSGGITNAIPAGTKINVTLEVHAEGEESPEGYSTKPEKITCKLQQSDMSLGKFTDIYKITNEYGEKQQSITMAQKAIEFKMKKELDLLLGYEWTETTSAGGV